MKKLLILASILFSSNTFAAFGTYCNSNEVSGFTTQDCIKNNGYTTFTYYNSNSCTSNGSTQPFSTYNTRISELGIPKVCLEDRKCYSVVLELKDFVIKSVVEVNK
jgi:hypothetical protein